MRPMGIVRTRHWLMYAGGINVGGRWVAIGFGAWLPHSVQRLVVHVWNHVACRLLGHEDLGLGRCQACCEPLPPDPVVMRAKAELTALALSGAWPRDENGEPVPLPFPLRGEGGRS